MAAPTAWMRKQRTSPPTKILVSQFGRIIEHEYWPVAWMMRLRNMYTDAANRIGARRMSSAWRMYANLLSGLELP